MKEDEDCMVHVDDTQWFASSISDHHWNVIADGTYGDDVFGFAGACSSREEGRAAALAAIDKLRDDLLTLRKQVEEVK